MINRKTGLGSNSSRIKFHKPSIILVPDFWIVLAGFFCASSVAIKVDCSQIYYLGIIGSFVGLFGGLRSIYLAIPIFGDFDKDSWAKKEGSDIKVLLIRSVVHGKGKWPMFKLMDKDGSEYFVEDQAVLPNGDIKISVGCGPSPEGRIMIK